MTDTVAPSLGERFCPFSSAMRYDPYPFYKRLRADEPVTYSPEIGAWVISRYVDIHQALADPNTFSSQGRNQPINQMTPEVLEVLRGGYPLVATASSSDGATHQRFRQLYVQGFSPRQTNNYAPFVHDAVTRYLDRLQPQGRADVIGELARPLTIEVILHAMGIPSERMADAAAWTKDLIGFVFAPVGPEKLVEHARGLVAFQNYIAELIDDRRAHRREDMISIMVHDQLPHAEPLSMAEMVTALCGLLMAGHKTLIDTVGNGLALLLNPRSRWQQLCADPTLIPGMIDEVLRFDSPLQGIIRKTTTEVIVAGVTIPAGERIYLLCGSANRDDGFFDHPDEFDMRRNPNRHLTLGHGPHFCVGAPLARLETYVLFEQLTSRFPGLRLIDAGALRREASAWFGGFNGYDDLPVAW